NGEKIPYVEVSRTFNVNSVIRNFDRIPHTNGRAYTIKRGYGGGGILPIPVVFTRRDKEEFSWFDIKRELTSMLYLDEPSYFSFTHDGDYFYEGFVISIDLQDTYDYVSIGVINILLVDELRVSSPKVISNTGVVNIKGHESTYWEVSTEFTSAATNFTISFGEEGVSDLRKINKVSVRFNFSVGDILVIDYLKRKITVNGVDISNSLVIIDSNYMDLPIGNVEISASNAFNLFYRERYYY